MGTFSMPDENDDEYVAPKLTGDFYQFNFEGMGTPERGVGFYAVKQPKPKNALREELNVLKQNHKQMMEEMAEMRKLIESLLTKTS